MATRVLLAAATGAFLGGIHGGILYISMIDDLAKLASVKLYANTYTLPTMIALIVDVPVLITVLTSGYWLPKLMDYRDEFVERQAALEEGVDEDEEEDEL